MPRISPAQAEVLAYTLYEGKETPHRSCGVALAETFGLPTSSYVGLRRGGITGEGSCGAIAAGTLVIAEILGDPMGPVSPVLKTAIVRYREILKEKLGAEDIGLEASCNARTAPQGDFMGESRKRSCTRLASLVANAAAEALAEVEASQK